MVAEGMNYPLHLGVTEAGDGEDGRIKSAVGIGTLLEDGLGDTVRVSLTEEPEAEAPVAIALVKRYTERVKGERLKAKGNDINKENLSPLTFSPLPSSQFSPYEYKRRHTYEANAFIGGHMVPRVVIDLSKKNLKDPAILGDAGYLYSALLDKYNMAEQSVDFVYFADELPSFTLPGNLKQLYNYKTWEKLADKTMCHPLFTLNEYIGANDRSSALNLVKLTPADIDSDEFGALPFDQSLVFVLETDSLSGMTDQRSFFFKMEELGLDVPVIVKRTYPEKSQKDHGPWSMVHAQEELTTLLQLYAATDLGALLVDGFGDGIWIDAPGIDTKTITSTAFGILQATRSRISKTEYISCPSCGRTLFDLMITTQMIRSRTSHLKGLKIGIMGCIVNGPGEMADADYGYVGSGTDKVTLYRGKEAVKKNISSVNALNELIGIIKEDGNWVEQE
jgi:(E)-4-hydroxy-3-methylbut-2-enyl-diphosphate synthase